MFEQQKKELEKLQKELQTRLDHLQKDLSSAHSSDSDEQAIERENDEVVEKLRDETELELSQVRQALKRIETGSYGQCEQCGEAINPQRLAALPYSTLCIQCAEQSAT